LYNSRWQGDLYIPYGGERALEMASGHDHASYIGLRKAEPNKKASEEHIDMKEVACAIVTLTSQCQRGTIPIGKGAWLIYSNWEEASKAGKRRRQASLDVRAPTLDRTKIAPRQAIKSQVREVTLIAGIVLFQLALEKV
jgi:hypothetical protein